MFRRAVTIQRQTDDRHRHRQIYRQTDGQTDRHADEQTARHGGRMTNQWMDRCLTDRQAELRTDGHISGWMVERHRLAGRHAGRQNDRQMDG